ncbi:MAG: ROK family protein [Actinobacteria bacterium]|nr:ROK family protein [Actinomycetota bacterium]
MTHQGAQQPTLGIDIGGTKTHAILLSASGQVLAQRVRPTEVGTDGVIAAALAAADDCLGSTGLVRSDLACVGVGIPGQVDHRTGEVRTAVNLGIERLDLGARLSSEFGVPVSVDNDVKAAALGAAAHLGIGDLSYLNVGTGVAAATLAEGRLVRGPGNLAGEIGHIPVAPGGVRCVCGQLGCLEAVVGGGRIAARLAPLAPAVTLPTLVAAAAAGDPDAVAEAGVISAGIATAVQLLVLTQGSALVVLGGGVIHTCVGLVDLVRRELAARANGSDFLASVDLAGRVAELPSDYPVAAIGAAMVARADAEAAAPASLG